jgi:hypothetical protein
MSSRFSVTVPWDYHWSTGLSASEEMLALKKSSRLENLRSAGLAASLGSAETHNLNFAF